MFFLTSSSFAFAPVNPKPKLATHRVVMVGIVKDVSGAAVELYDVKKKCSKKLFYYGKQKGLEPGNLVRVVYHVRDQSIIIFKVLQLH